jgi:hypothetical protein
LCHVPFVPKQRAEEKKEIEKFSKSFVFKVDFPVPSA